MFAALVARHGPMVLNICLQSLGDRHHAEDAFQAVFLVLARKARSIRDPNLLGAWLYGVALRTARKAKTRLSRQGNREESAGVSGLDSQLLVGSDGSASQRAGLGPRAGRNPARRDRPPAEAVSHCHCPLLLRGSHARRGGAAVAVARRHRPQPTGPSAREAAARPDSTRCGPVGPALMAALSSRSASASITPHLCNLTTRAATSFTAGQAARGIVSASVYALAQEVLRAMLFTRLKLVTLILFVLAAVTSRRGAVEPIPRQAG